MENSINVAVNAVDITSGTSVFKIEKKECTCCYCIARASKRRKPLKGRKSTAGAQNGNAKLSDAKVKKIMKLKDGPYKTQWVAKKFGVDHQTIYQIWRGLIWTKVTGVDKRKVKNGPDLQGDIIDTTYTPATTVQAIDGNGNDEKSS